MSLPTLSESEKVDPIGYALKELSEGSHPLSYLSTAKLSLDAHAVRYAESEHYRRLFDSATLGCLGFWKEYVNARLVRPADDVIDVNDDGAVYTYEQLCARNKPKSKIHDAPFSKKSDWQALLKHIEDIEHYAYKLAPALEDLGKQSEMSILSRAEERAFTITIVDSAVQKDEDDV